MNIIRTGSRGLLAFCLLLLLNSVSSPGQEPDHQYLGWSGQGLMSMGQFTGIHNWVINPQPGNSLTLIPEDSAIHMRWKLAGGQGRWVQIYHVFDPPLSIDHFNLFASDIKGSSCGETDACHRNVTVEFKFENGTKQAVFVRRGEEGLLGIDRWVQKLFLTISYINAGGPGSNRLMRNLLPFINPDGSVPHYNDNIGVAAGIWAVPWESLDGTSWLYFTASKRSPLKPLNTGFNCLQTSHDEHEIPGDPVTIYPNPAEGVLHLVFPDPVNTDCEILMYNMEGELVMEKEIHTSDPVDLDISSLRKGIYLVKIRRGKDGVSKKIILL